MSIRANIAIHEPDCKVELRCHNLDGHKFWVCAISGVKFFFDTEVEVEKFKDAITDAFDKES